MKFIASGVQKLYSEQTDRPDWNYYIEYSKEHASCFYIINSMDFYGKDKKIITVLCNILSLF